MTRPHRIAAALNRRTLLFMAALAWAGLAPAGLSAQSMPTAELAQFCDSEEADDQAFCAGYIAGIVHALAVPPEMMPDGVFCREADQVITLSNFASNLVAVNESDERVKLMPSHIVLARMLEQAFPCDEEFVKDTVLDPAIQMENPDAEGAADPTRAPGAKGMRR